MNTATKPTQKARNEGAIGSAMGFFSRMFFPGLLGRWSRQVTLNNLPDFAAVISQLRPGSFVDVYLDDKLLIRRDLHLPKTTRKKALQALKLETEQSVPGSSDRLVRADHLRQADNGVAASAFLFPKQSLEDLLAIATKQNQQVRTVAPASQPNALLFDARRKTDRTAIIWAGGSLAVAIATFCFIAAQFFEVKGGLDLRVAALDLQIDTLEQRLTAQETRRQDQDAEAGRIQGANAALLYDRQALDILLAIANKLPKSTWISEFMMADGKVSLALLSGENATEILSLIDDLDPHRTAHLDGPISRDNVNQINRFRIVLSGASP